MGLAVYGITYTIRHGYVLGLFFFVEAFKIFWFEVMLFEKAVNFEPILSSQRCCLIHIAFSKLKEANEVPPFVNLRMEWGTWRGGCS
jgi:hypothetical protein